jgi:AraC-like DNA-binding protein
MDRKNGTLAGYREFAPCDALRRDVYALFSFGPGSTLPVPPRPLLREVVFREPILCAPQFADGHVSIVFEVGRTFDAAGRWHVDPNALCGTVIGPLRAVGRTRGVDLAETVGAYFRPGRVAPFFDVAISELTDSTVAIGDIWGTSGSQLSSELCEVDTAARLDRLELMLLTRLRRQRQPRTGALDVPGLAASVIRARGRVSVEAMARAAGVSRQHLTREFRERIGIGPKLYTRLARFQSVLAYAGSRAKIDWATVALDMGFADQSHMIAEVRQFSGLTPHALLRRDWFHPFIERARSVPADRGRSREYGRSGRR